VAFLEHVADHRRCNRQLSVDGELLGTDRHLRAPGEHDRLLERADPELRSLKVGDQRDRAADLCLDLAHAPRTPPVVVVRTVGEIQPCCVHAGRHERAYLLRRVRRRAECRDDLRAAFRNH
jgi:hypothetical protein